MIFPPSGSGGIVRMAGEAASRTYRKCTLSAQSSRARMMFIWRSSSTSPRVSDRFERSSGERRVPSASPVNRSNTRSSQSWSPSSTTTVVTFSGPTTSAQRLVRFANPCRSQNRCSGSDCTRSR